MQRPDNSASGPAGGAARSLKTPESNPNAPAITVIKKALLLDGFKFSEPLTPGPLTVRDANGVTYTANEKQLVNCIAALSGQVKMPVTLMITLNKSDVWLLCQKYRRNRKTNKTNLAILVERMNNHDWVGGYPNLKWDTTKDQVDGKHSMLAFLNSNLETMTFCVIIGIDVAMGSRHDTNTPRDIVAQGLYLPFDAYRGLKNYTERKNFMSSAGYITQMLSEFKIWPELALVKAPKRQLCQHPMCQFIVQKVAPHFLITRKIIHDQRLDAEGISQGQESLTAEASTDPDVDKAGAWTKAAIMTFGTILIMNGQKEIFLALAAGANLEADSYMLKLRSLLVTCSVDQSAAQRETGQVFWSVIKFLSYVFAQQEGLPKLPKLLPRIKIMKGVVQRIYSEYPREERTADRKIQKQIVSKWLTCLKPPTLEDLKALQLSN